MPRTTVFGARKVWLTLNRERPTDEAPIARCTVERLMSELGLAGARRGKVKRTTISDRRAAKPHDLVNRDFRPLAPGLLWVADFTYVSTWSGWCYTSFVIDAYARRILGWYLSVAYAEHLDAAGIKPSTGPVGSSFDNALAEAVIGLYKTELMEPRRPWKGFDDLELATAEWIDWFNHRRPFEYCDDLTPVEAEAAHYAHRQTPATAAVSS